MSEIDQYEKQVYAGLLGKIIGVYLGRPFEQWRRAQIEERWGVIDRYVHEDRGVPLVVADDDLSGTMTFVRALEDSELYENTPVELFGETWLNYIMEQRAILWWGGNGMSTEHTAYLNLKNGIRAPESGSIAVNGRAVAEQIGAQIFIDAFGLVTPGRPDMAADLARRAASVAHDGEAVYAACVVAAMISAAFVEKDMERLLDIGVSHIPSDSLIARAHRDVRAWVRRHESWTRTFEEIEKQYGYARFDGVCHVVPNHAVMVMAWSYAPDSFYRAQQIVNTAGYDTDCNAANVGSVMGVKVGLERINEEYDFQSPFADRLILPTAEGTRSVSDALTESLNIAAIGRKIMKWPACQPIKRNALHHFEMPGALHGYLPEEDRFETRGTTRVSNAVIPNQGRGLRIAFDGLNPKRFSRVSAPMLPAGPGAVYGQARQMQAAPRLYPGMEATLHGYAGRELSGTASVRLFLRPYDDAASLIYTEPLTLNPGHYVSMTLKAPREAWPIRDFGIEINGHGQATGPFYVDSVRFTGTPFTIFPDTPLLGPAQEPVGWINDLDQIIIRPFPADRHPCFRIGKNSGTGVMVTGTRDWNDYTFEATLSVNRAARAGLIVRYQGLRRYVAVVRTSDRLQLIQNFYGETALDEIPVSWQTGEEHTLTVRCEAGLVRVWLDGEAALGGQVAFLEGGAGFLVDQGLVAVRGAAAYDVGTGFKSAPERNVP